MNENYAGAAGQILFWLHLGGHGADGAEVREDVTEEEKKEEEPSDAEPKTKFRLYRQENKSLLATLFQISKS